METSQRAKILVNEHAMLSMIDFEGGEIVRAELSDYHIGGVVLTIIHPDFKPVERGAEVPDIQPLYTEACSMYRGRLIERIVPVKKEGKLLA